MKNIWSICATAGRHTCLERSVRFFIDQDYEGEHTLLIFNNSEVPQALNFINELPDNKHIMLVNQSIDSTTGERYETLGAIYNDALKCIPNECEVIIFWDDDDIFLPMHIKYGMEGLNLAVKKGLKAYKPYHSYYRNARGEIEIAVNTLEPSIFTLASHIKGEGFSLTTSDQHMQWLRPLTLTDSILVDEIGEPTLVYNWGDGNNIPTFKTSGNPNNPDNFKNYRTFSQDHGDHIITPITRERSERYYRQVEYFEKK